MHIYYEYTEIPTTKYFKKVRYVEFNHLNAPPYISLFKKESSTNLAK